MRVAIGSSLSKWICTISSRSYPRAVRRTSLARRIVPLSLKLRNPQGALLMKSTGASSAVIGDSASGMNGLEVLLHRVDRLTRMAHVRTVSRSLKHHKGALYPLLL